MQEPLHSLLYYAPHALSPGLAEYEALPAGERPLYLIATHPVYLPARFARSRRVLIDMHGYHPQHREVLASGALLLAPASNQELAKQLRPGEDYCSFEPGQLALILQQLDAAPALENRITTTARQRQHWPEIYSVPTGGLSAEQPQPAWLSEAEPLLEQLLRLRRQGAAGLVLHLLAGLKQLLPAPSEATPEIPPGRLCQLQEPLWPALRLWYGGLHALQLLAQVYELEALSQLGRWEELGQAAETALQLTPFLSLFQAARMQALQILQPGTDLSAHWAQAVAACPLEISFWKSWLSALLPRDPEQALQVVQQARSLNLRLVSALEELEYFQAYERRIWAQHPDWNPEPSRLRYVLWEGEIQAHNSLARINRHLLQGLAADPDLYLTVLPFLDPEFREAEPPGDRQNHAQTPDVFVSHRWPPRLHPPQQGRWVNILPWEHGAIPAAWIPVLNTQLDQIWVPSAFVARCMQQSGVDSAQIRVIPNGVDLNLYTPGVSQLDLPGGPERLRFLFVGGLLPAKGVDILLQAYAQAFTRSDPVQLVIKGFGARDLYSKGSLGDRFQAFESDPQLPEVQLISRSDFTEAELVDLYRACDVYVHPYRGEGFGLPILEAMACGLPVVVPDAGPATEFTTPESAWYIPTWTRFLELGAVAASERPRYTPFFHEPDAEALAQLLRQIAGQPELIARKGKAARIQAEAFSWEQMTQRTRAAIEALALGPPPRRHRTDWRPEPWLKQLREALPVDSREFGQLLGQALKAGISLNLLQQSGLSLPATPPLRLSWPPSSDPLLPRLPAQPGLLIQARPDQASLSVSWQAGNGIRWLLERPETLPTPQSCQAVWYAQPELCAELEALGWPRERLLYLPHAVDFQHYSPTGPMLELNGSPGRHVFLSCPDLRRDTSWQTLLSAYTQTFRENDPVMLVLRPQGLGFEEATEQVLYWLEQSGQEPEQIAALVLIQETLDPEHLPRLLRAAQTLIELQPGPCLIALAAQACGLKVIACAQQPFLQRPFAEFWTGSPEHLSWLLRQALAHKPDSGSPVRQWLQDEYDLPRWQARSGEWLAQWRLLQQGLH